MVLTGNSSSTLLTRVFTGLVCVIVGACAQSTAAGGDVPAANGADSTDLESGDAVTDAVLPDVSVDAADAALPPDVSPADAAISDMAAVDASAPADAVLVGEVVDGTDGLPAALDAASETSETAMKLPIGCPPDPLPSWVPPIAVPSPVAPPPGLTCALPGWPGPIAADPLVWTAASGTLPLPAGTQLDRCLVWQDVNGDGLGDLIFFEVPTTLDAKRKLVTALGQPDGTLVAVSQQTTLFWEPTDCVVADLEHDGKPELLVSALPGLAILELTGPKAGADVTAKFTTAQFPYNGAISVFDVDADGDEDVYLAGNQNYSLSKGNFDCGLTDPPYFLCCLDVASLPCMQAKAGKPDVASCCVASPPASPHSILRNDGGKLVDISSAFVLDTGAGMTVTPRDIDRDGRVDFFLGNDFGHHGWYINRVKTFVFQSTDVGMRPYGHVMGSAIADFDGDRRDDLMIADWGPTTLYKGTDSGFVDVSATWGNWPATNFTINWAQLVEDLDRDGWPDLVTTTSLHTQPGKFAAIENEDPTGYAPGFHLVGQNTGKSFVFNQLPWIDGADPGVDSVSAAAGDFDHDGDLDLFLISPRGWLSIWRNDTKTSNHWLNVQPRDSAGPVRGALVQVWAQGHVQELRVAGATGWGTHHEPSARFGLGGVTALDRVRVWWPTGEVTDIDAPPIDTDFVVQKP